MTTLAVVTRALSRNYKKSLKKDAGKTEAEIKID